MRTKIVKQFIEIEVRKKILYVSYKAFDEYGKIRIEYCNFFLNNVKSMDKIYTWAQKYNINNGTILTYETSPVNNDSNITVIISFARCIFKLLFKKAAKGYYK